MSGEDAARSVQMEIPGLGSFVRALLPVHLEHEHRFTYGVWVGVSPEDLQRARDVWWEPEYDQLTIEGRLANAVPPGASVGAPVRLVVRDPEHTPYCDSSPDADVYALLNSTWRAVDGAPAEVVGP
jgi:hypothetical protein